MSLPFEPYQEVPRLQSAVTDAFCELAHQTIEANGVFRVSLSGGSTPKRVYEMLRDRDLPWGKVHLFWGDERNVPHDHDDSNFKMVKTALLDHVEIPPSNIHCVPVSPDTPTEAAKNYETQLRAQFDEDFPTWDLVLLGMGDDAHTASLFPHTSALEEAERWFIENWVEKFDAFRYTLTYPAIASGKNIWFIITGAAKQAALRQVLAGETDPGTYPSQRIRPTRWFVSADAC
ncbi:MAG: 6-phosphogluconolactonase [Planctomycetota bacterium]